MSEVHQMIYSHGDAFVAVGSKIADIWITRDEIVKKHSWHGSVFQLLDPGIMQCKTHQKGSAIAVFQQKGIVFFLFLKCRGDGKNINIPFAAERILFETENYVISEFIDGFVIHVFYENAKLAIFHFLGALGAISHLHSSIENHLPQLITYVACAV